MNQLIEVNLEQITPVITLGSNNVCFTNSTQQTDWSQKFFPK